MNEPLLFTFFAYLRKAGLPLGIDDYLLLLSTLRAGQGLDDPDTFRFTCQLLWAKSPEDQRLLDESYDMLVLPWLQPQSDSTKEQLPSDFPRSSVGEMTPTLPPIVPSPSSLAGKDPLRPGVVPLRLPTVRRDPNAPKALGSYQMTPRLPIARREMARIWRNLRRLQRQGPPVDLDVEGTIQGICRWGFLLHPVLQARRRNQVRLLILIDGASEMAPFAPLIDALVDSIYRGGLLGHATAFYYYECPQDVLFARPGHLDAHSTSTVLAKHARGGSAIIISAAGAARPWRSAEQVRCIQDFLRSLRSETYRYAWLNPLPPQRWRGTTAGDIARMVPMFSINRDGLIDTVNILRGHPFPPGVNLDVQWD